MQQEITDENRWFTLLAFLRHLPDQAAQAGVLRRRLDFLEQPASFFYGYSESDGERPLRAEELDDPFRRGILTIARATSLAELTWLRATLGSPGSGSRPLPVQHRAAAYARDREDAESGDLVAVRVALDLLTWRSSGHAVRSCSRGGRWS
ncbi:hypothetical protein GCM10020367_67760 [Streptomyces sannanensis]|uniref:Uncharacterized protein n=1 Tax=Streptomyces sannanensis TaxID=285536 RepID=A0ABP6SMQ9_9ACTN